MTWLVGLLWVVNFAISWLNAWGCGSTWDDTAERGGVAHFMNWMGAIMSASGFTWCYLVVVGLLGAVLPMSAFVDAEPGAPAVTGMLLDEASLKAFFDLGYLVIIFPILGSGLAITVASWRRLAQGHGGYFSTGWNTFAQAHNMYQAAQHVPDIFDNLGSFFSSKDSKDARGAIVVLLVLLALFGGVVTTASIIQLRRRNLRLLARA